MPKPKKVQPPPEIYKITQRRYMGKGAAIEKLPPEESVDGIGSFSDIKYAISWIESNGNKDNVYVIRNRRGEMIHSYCFRSKGRWSIINNDNYMGGYKIGNPKHPLGCPCCSPMIPSDKMKHPAMINKDYE